MAGNITAVDNENDAHIAGETRFFIDHGVVSWAGIDILALAESAEKLARRGYELNTSYGMPKTSFREGYFQVDGVDCVPMNRYFATDDWDIYQKLLRQQTTRENEHSLPLSFFMRGVIFGLRGSTIGFNYPRVKAWKNRAIVATGIAETERSLNKAGINVIHGSAHFIDPQTITVGRVRFKAKQFVVATGTQTHVTDVPGLAKGDFLTPKEALELMRPPKSIAIFGGNSTAIEFASIFGSFGSKVYLVEKSAHLLVSEDPLAGQTVRANLEKQYDVNCIPKATLQSVAKRGNKKQLILKVAGRLHTIVVDEIMMADASTPSTDIGLENAGVKYTSSGVTVNTKLQTSAKHIYAVGNVIGGKRPTHDCLYQGRVAARNLINPKKSTAVNYLASPRVVFSSPEVACVGLSTEELKEEKVATKSSVTDISIVGRSHTSLAASGFVKITADKRTNKLVSAVIVAPHASEMIHELTLAIQNNLTAADIARTNHAFPTWSEAIRVTATKLAV